MESAVSRIRELLSGHLESLTEEKGRVERAIQELGNDEQPPSAGEQPKPPSRRGRPKGSKSRARRGGGRADQAVLLVQKKPGISASEIAKSMKIKPNYLYRVLGDLEKEGRVRKEGRCYSPA